MPIPSNELYEFGPFTLDAVQRVLTRDAQRVPLASKTFDLLLVLVRTPGRAFTKSELMTALWPDTFVEEANLSFQVSTLRKARDGAAEWIERFQSTGRFIDQAGRAEGAQRVDRSPVTGQYLASDGRTCEDVWGSRGPWMALTGTVDGEALTIAILDHPKNPGSPTLWHARGYGLFAANPFGAEAFDAKQSKSPTTLPASASFTFRHRIVIRGGKASREELQKAYEQFLAAQS
jgi:hypothetical protein